MSMKKTEIKKYIAIAIDIINILLVGLSVLSFFEDGGNGSVVVKDALCFGRFNLILLLVSTGLVYINGRVESIVTQTMVLSSFYFTTNSLLALFIDFLNPLLKAKKDLIKNNRVSKQDLDNAEKEAKEQEAIEVITKIIESKDFDKYSKEEKEALVKKCFNTDKN